MAMSWRITNLSVSYLDADGNRRYDYEMGHADVESLGFDAGEAIVAAAAGLIRLDTKAAAGTATTPTIAGTVATTTVSGLTRDVAFELAITFQRSDGRNWTRTLVIPCVA